MGSQRWRLKNAGRTQPDTQSNQTGCRNGRSEAQTIGLRLGLFATLSHIQQPHQTHQLSQASHKGRRHEQNGQARQIDKTKKFALGGASEPPAREIRHPGQREQQPHAGGLCLLAGSWKQRRHRNADSTAQEDHQAKWQHPVNKHERQHVRQIEQLAVGSRACIDHGKRQHRSGEQTNT